MNELDVYRFHYKPEVAAKMFEPHHCFDGQLIFRDGVLRDTYWGFSSSIDGRAFRPAEAEEKGTLTFLCNLNEVEKVPEHVYAQYADEDAFNLSCQHGCYKHFMVRKGAAKNLLKRQEILARRMSEARSEADSAQRRAFSIIEQCTELRMRLEDGEDLTV